MQNTKKFNQTFLNGFTIVELIIAVGMISTLSGFLLPSFINWVRTEKVNAYTRELKEYFRVIRLDARRWGASCNVNTNFIPYEKSGFDKNIYGFRVNCDDKSKSINSQAPIMNNSIFQISNKDFLITPNGRISSDKSIVIVIGSQHFNAGSRILNCLIIQAPTGHVIKGNYINKDWIHNQMELSKIDENNIITNNQCRI